MIAAFHCRLIGRNPTDLRSFIGGWKRRPTASIFAISHQLKGKAVVRKSKRDGFYSRAPAHQASRVKLSIPP